MNGHWERLAIPGPRPKLLIGNLDLLFFGNKSAVLTLNEWTRRFGPIYGIRYGHKNLLIISEPEMVHELLVTKFNNFHGRLVKFSKIMYSIPFCVRLAQSRGILIALNGFIYSMPEGPDGNGFGQLRCSHFHWPI